MSWLNLTLACVDLGLVLLLATSHSNRLWSVARRPTLLAFQVAGVLLITWVIVSYAAQSTQTQLLTGNVGGRLGPSDTALLAQPVNSLVLGSLWRSLVPMGLALAFASLAGLFGAMAVTSGERGRWASLGPVATLLWIAPTFLISAVSLWAIRKPEPQPEPAAASGQSGFWHEMWEGIQVVVHNPTLWKIAGCTATANLGSNMAFAVELIFMYRYLHLAPGLVGVIFAIGSVGGLLGAVASSAVVARLGVGVTLLISILGGGLLMATPLAAQTNAAVFLSALFFVEFLIGAPYNITQVSLRQAITPDRVQGRMNATMRTIVWGTIPIGSLLGGVSGTLIGVVPTIVIGGFISLLAAVWILLGPIRIRVQPDPVG